MDSSKPRESDPEDDGTSISININSPNNRVIATHEYIEVNIHMGPRSGSDSPESDVEPAAEIRRVLSNVVDYVRRETAHESASRQ